MFVVIQQGVYRHGIVGVFSTFELAKAAATDAASIDDYHSFDVIECILDVVIQIQNMNNDGREVLFSAPPQSK